MKSPDKIKMLKESPLELQFYEQCLVDPTVPEPFWHIAKFGVETDFLWPAFRLIVQIQGGVEDGQGRSRGAHVRKAGYVRDRDLSNKAQLFGWTVFEFTRTHLDDNSAIKLVSAFINGGSVEWGN